MALTLRAASPCKSAVLPICLPQAGEGKSTARNEAEVDFPIFETRTQHLHAHRVAEPELEPAPLAREQMPHRIEMVIVVRQLRDVHEPGDLRVDELDEKPERRHARHDARELAADVLLHPRALVALVDVALGFV